MYKGYLGKYHNNLKWVEYQNYPSLVGITEEDDDWGDGPFRARRDVLLPIFLELCFLASKIEAKSHYHGKVKWVVMINTPRDELWLLPFTIPVAMFLVHIFEKLRQRKTGR